MVSHGPTDHRTRAQIKHDGKQSGSGNAVFVTGTANGTVGYTLTATSLGNGNDTFTYTATNGSVSRTCSGSGGGCNNGSW